jgi:hypothetical protein
MSTRAQVIAATQAALTVAEALPTEVTPAPQPGPMPVPPPAPEGTPLIGVCNLLDGFYWNSSPGGPVNKTAMQAVLRTKYDRIPTSGDLSWVKTAVGVHLSPLVIWTGNAAGLAKALPELKGLGISRIEWQNEAYKHGFSAQSYATSYHEAQKALEGSGIVLIANIQIGNTSQAGTELWIKTVGTVQAWSVHLYSAVGEGFAYADTNTPAGPGLKTLPKLLPMLRAPLYLTEYGQPTKEGTDHVKEVSPEAQADGAQAMIEAAQELPLAGAWWFEAVDTAEGAYGLYSRTLEVKPAAHRLGEQLGLRGLASA